jgi:uncharacterized protein YjiS (DUF1127 family)
MNTRSTALHAPYDHRPDLAGLFARALTRAWLTVETWQDRASQRRTLASLPPELLEDIGVTADRAGAEIRKPFWQA